MKYGRRKQEKRLWKNILGPIVRSRNYSGISVTGVFSLDRPDRVPVD